MKILVTGGAGFIASHVADGYIAEGHSVAIVDDLSRGSLDNLNPKARFYKGDIQDRTFLESVFEREKPETVNHHAAQMNVRRGVTEPIFDASVNILGSINLLEAAVRHKTRRVTYISTAGAAYGEPRELPVSEEHAVNPITPYGISKHTVEHYLFTFSFLYGLEYVVLRYGNVYGPRQNSQGEAGVFAVFCEQMLAGIQPVIYGDGTKYRDYVFVEDAVRANLAALHRGQGEAFNIGSGVPVTDWEIFAIVRDLLQSKIEPRFSSIRPGEIEKIILNTAKAERLLNWKPQISIAEGARRTVAHFAARAESALALAGKNG
jgi:UDP-glucose 4-epimerase